MLPPFYTVSCLSYLSSLICMFLPHVLFLFFPITPFLLADSCCCFGAVCMVHGMMYNCKLETHLIAAMLWIEGYIHITHLEGYR